MMAIITEVVLEGEYGDAVILEEYNGTYSLVSGQKSKTNDKVYSRWAFPQLKDKQPGPKAMPIKVKLGKKDEAIGVLTNMIQSLSWNNEAPKNDSDVPF